MRDYVHVVDLTEGRVAALDAVGDGEPLQIIDLGIGRGTSVVELVSALEQATGMAIPCVDAEPRSGDIAELYAAVDKAERGLGWRAARGVREMCADSWRFASRNQPSFERSRLGFIASRSKPWDDFAAQSVTKDSN